MVYTNVIRNGDVFVAARRFGRDLRTTIATAVLGMATTTCIARQWSCYACGDPDTNFVVGRIEFEDYDECPREPPNCEVIIDDCTGKLNVWFIGCGMQQDHILGTCSTTIGPCFDSVWGRFVRRSIERRFRSV